MMEKPIAVILARGGSKRIPGKNIRLFMGKPAIAYPIEAALQSGLFETVLVSTDDPYIAEIAQQYGASVPFLRSASNSGDAATSAEAVKEVLLNLIDRNLYYSDLCVIYPTAVLLKAQTLVEAYRMFQSGKYQSVMSIQALRHPAGRALLEDHGFIRFQWPENALKRSQDLPKSYVDAGQFYWLKWKDFLNEGKIISDKTGGLLLDYFEAQDIDEEADWKIAEWKYQYKA
jgi:N-acylneuraminate cytidylyltransferase